MDMRAVKKEMKQHCIAIAALAAKLKSQNPKADEVSIFVNTTDGGYATFNVTIVTGKDHHSVANMFNMNVLNDKWTEHEPFTWNEDEEVSE